MTVERVEPVTLSTVCTYKRRPTGTQVVARFSKRKSLFRLTFLGSVFHLFGVLVFILFLYGLIIIIIPYILHVCALKLLLPAAFIKSSATIIPLFIIITFFFFLLLLFPSQ